MKLLAVDIGSKYCGLAFFKGSILKKTQTIESPEKWSEISRRFFMCVQFVNAVEIFDPNIIVFEDPFHRGKAAKILQRLIGNLEVLAIIGKKNQSDKLEFYYINPSKVKKLFGNKSKDKLDVALGVKKALGDEYEVFIRNLIEEKRFDETDAVAVGLSYIIENGR